MYFLYSSFSISSHQVVKVARFARLVHIYGVNTGLSQSMAIELGGPRCAMYLPLLALQHTVWSTRKRMSTRQGLGA